MLPFMSTIWKSRINVSTVLNGRRRWAIRQWHRLFLAVVTCVVTCWTVVAEDKKQTPLEQLSEKIGQIGDRLIDTGESSSNDPVRELQSSAIREQQASWGHWGNKPKTYSAWTNHSNRLIPLYTFGIDLHSLRESGSSYQSEDRLKSLYGHVTPGTLQPTAGYLDQTAVYHLQHRAIQMGKRHLIVMVFDGMDWQTTRAAAVYQNGEDLYDTGRGRGLAFQDYRGVRTDFAFIATSAMFAGAKPDVNAQQVTVSEVHATGGFDAKLAGPMPWHEQTRSPYPIGRDREHPHTVTDSAASATSMFSGIKTYNGSINIRHDGTHVVPIARQLQQRGFRVGVVTSVPISHATPGAAYANNVSRKDYQDITRDMIGRPSSSHRDEPLPGLDVVMGGGHGEGSGKQTVQGENFLPGNMYLHESDLDEVRIPDGPYVVAQPIEGRAGNEVLKEAAGLAIRDQRRLLAFFGTRGGHLPFRTADGAFNPTFDVKGTERYSAEVIRQNPTLAEMSAAALDVLSSNTSSSQDDESNPLTPFWLLIEPGDVDWANHANNLDNSIGAVISGEAAFSAVVRWVEDHDAWDDTALIVTSDHGHFLVLDDTQPIAEAGRQRR